MRSSGGSGPSLRPRSPSHAAKNKTPEDRICEFGYMLMEREGRLICRPCNLILDHTRRSTIVEHLRSRKHHRYVYDAETELDAAVEPPIVVMDVEEDSVMSNPNHSSSPSRQPSPAPQGMTGPYLLKRETHCNTILDELLRDETYADVTLTAQGQNIKAHRLILSLSSSYFKTVLNSEANAKNVILFREMKFDELKNIVNFIYTGEVTVDAEDLDSFMKTAEILEVTSLCNSHKKFPRGFNLPEDSHGRTPAATHKRPNSTNHKSPPAKIRKTTNDKHSTPKFPASTPHFAQYRATSSSSPVPPASKSSATDLATKAIGADLAAKGAALAAAVVANIGSISSSSENADSPADTYQDESRKFKGENDEGDDDPGELRNLKASADNCIACAGSFPDMNSLLSHVEEFHFTEAINICTCEECLRIFHSRKEFNKHRHLFHNFEENTT